jgi:hypothetical protein
VRVTSLSPLGGYMNTPTSIEVIGSNFVDTSYFALQFGDNRYFCAQNAPLTVCPNDDTYTNNAVTFVNMFVVRLTVPTSPVPTRRLVMASNNYQVPCPEILLALPNTRWQTLRALLNLCMDMLW